MHNIEYCIGATVKKSIISLKFYLVCFKCFRGSLIWIILIGLRSWVSFSRWLNALAAERLNCTSVFQLLMPHIQSTLQINIQARVTLLATKGVFDKVGFLSAYSVKEVKVWIDFFIVILSNVKCFLFLFSLVNSLWSGGNTTAACTRNATSPLQLNVCARWRKSAWTGCTTYLLLCTRCTQGLGCST